MIKTQEELLQELLSEARAAREQAYALQQSFGRMIDVGESLLAEIDAAKMAGAAVAETRNPHRHNVLYTDGQTFMWDDGAV